MTLPTCARREVLLSNSLERFLYILHRIAKYHWTSVRTRHRMLGFCQFREQPFHLVLGKRHVDLDRRMTGDAGGNPRARVFKIVSLLFALEGIQHFTQRVFYFFRANSGRRSLDRDGARAKWFRFESVLVQFFRDLSEYRLLSRRQLDD
jgi:hypothetical protein